jgi:hypothetical protein
MSVPPVVSVPIPISMPIRRMLCEDVVMPIRRKIISIANLTTAGSLACYIRD